MIYTDNAATTKLSKCALEAMLPFLNESYGNPSSIYSLGRNAKIAVEEAREKISITLDADKNEIYFTGGGSEADNWGIKGACYFARRRFSKSHIITTVFEHHAVLHTMQALERDGFQVTYVPVDENGLVNPSDIRAAIRKDTALVSVMYANNEIGTIQPISEIGEICKAAGVLFHTDAVQAYGSVRIDVKKENIDLLSVSAHKIHGPKGVGALYIRKGVSLENLIEGGAQERNRRAGTENTAGIIGFATAAGEAYEDFDERITRITTLRDKLIDQVLSSFERVRLNGDRYKRLPGNTNFSFEGIEGEALLLMLDLEGICGSSGSACTSGSLDPSHVLLSIGLPHEIAHGSLRLSLSDENTLEEMDQIVEKLKKIVARLRQMSPVWEEIQKREGKRG